MESSFRFTLDLNSVQSQVSIPTFLGDTGRTFHINLSDGGAPFYIPDGCLAKLSIKRPTGTTLEEFCRIENNTTAVYPFSQNENTCAVEGIHNCDVTLYDADGLRIGSSCFTMVVSEKAISRDDIELSDEDWTAVNAMLAEEVNRRSNEETRMSNEDLRVKAEEERVDAEEARVEAEAQRIKATAEDAERAEAAADRSEEAADRSEKVAEKMETYDEQLHVVNRRLKVLESGVIAGFETDSTVAYQKTVPSNALLYAELEKSGVNTGNYKTSNFYTGSREFELNAPYEVGVKKEICTVKLPAGMYYVSFSGGYGAGYMTTDDMARIMINDVESRYVTLDTAQVVTVYAVMYQDDSANGSDFETHNFYDIGIFAVTSEGEVPSYEEPSGAEIVNAPLTAIISNGKTYTVPDSLIELQKSMACGDGGYGYDYIDWVNKKLVKCMKGVDMGTLEWTYTAKTFRCSPENMKAVVENIGVFCEDYSYLGFIGTGGVTLTELGCVNTGAGQIRIKDSTYSDAEAFKAAMSGKMLYYEVAESEETDIDTGDFDRFIEVEPDGTITFVNENNGAIPSTITYQLKEA